MNGTKQRVTHKFFDSNIYTIRYGAFSEFEGRGIPQVEDRGCDILRFNLNTKVISIGATQISGSATMPVQPLKMKLHYTPETSNQDSVVTIGTDNLTGKKPLSEIAMSFRSAEIATGGKYEYSEGMSVYELPIYTKTIKVFGREANMNIGGIPIMVNVFSNLGHVGVSDERRSDAKLKYSIKGFLFSLRFGDRTE